MSFSHIRMGAVITFAAALGLAGCCSSKTPCSGAQAASAPAVGDTVGENMVSTTAIVKSIDQKTRKVKLQRADGSTFQFVAGDEVRNLDQVKAGDELVVTYYESLAYDVRKAGQGGTGASVIEEVGRAKQGEKPGAAGARATTITATITAIDTKANTVTLRGPDGESTTIKARHPEKLRLVAVGDLVDITYTEAMAISVESPSAK